MVRQSHRDAKGLRQVWNQTEVHLLRACGVCARALQKHNLAVACLANSPYRVLDFSLRRHAGRYNYRLSSLRRAANQSEVDDFRGRDLIGWDFHLLEKFDGPKVKGRGKQVHSQIVRYLLQLRLPIPGSERL